jgi:hypothetical protein
MTKPAVGTVVHFYDPTRIFNGVNGGPFAAMVTQVFTDAAGEVTYANLYVMPPFAPAYDAGSVCEKGSALDNGSGRHFVQLD